jgi:hypothetical protein
MISVIIIATYPSKFLRSSVDSVLSQTLCREDYEIIVVKNYKEIDDFLRSHNIISILWSNRICNRLLIQNSNYHIWEKVDV